MTLTIWKNLVLIFFNLPVLPNFPLSRRSFACYKFGVKGVFESKCLFASDGVLLSKPRRKMSFPIYFHIYDKRWMDWMTTDWMMTIGWLNLIQWMDWMTMSRLDDNGLVGLNWIRLATDWMMTIAALLTQFARSLGAVRIGQSGGLII